jgi:hypothetical protein
VLSPSPSPPVRAVFVFLCPSCGPPCLNCLVVPCSLDCPPSKSLWFVLFFSVTLVPSRSHTRSARLCSLPLAPLLCASLSAFLFVFCSVCVFTRASCPLNNRFCLLLLSRPNVCLCVVCVLWALILSRTFVFVCVLFLLFVCVLFRFRFV